MTSAMPETTPVTEMGRYPLRRFSSRSTASRMKSDRFSLSARTASILSSVPPGKRAGVCSSLIRGRPTVERISDISFCAKPCILLISPIDHVPDITYSTRYQVRSQTK
jgi:hypothetical protein